MSWVVPREAIEDSDLQVVNWKCDRNLVSAPTANRVCALKAFVGSNPTASVI